MRGKALGLSKLDASNAHVSAAQFHHVLNEAGADEARKNVAVREPVSSSPIQQS
jgi:hypothetical protein